MKTTIVRTPRKKKKKHKRYYAISMPGKKIKIVSYILSGYATRKKYDWFGVILRSHKLKN